MTSKLSTGDVRIYLCISLSVFCFLYFCLYAVHSLLVGFGAQTTQLRTSTLGVMSKVIDTCMSHVATGIDLYF